MGLIIGIMSDSHGSLKWFKRAYNLLKDTDLIIHAGDILYHGPRNPLPDEYLPKELSEFINTIPKEKIIFVKGNCDSDVDQMVINHDISKRFKIIDIKPFTMGIIHGDQFKNDSEMFKFMEEFDIDILIHGHYHVKKAVSSNNKIIISPGSVSLPKDSSKSAGILTIEKFNVAVEFFDLSSGELLVKKSFKLVK